jgi:hypothetical protein
VLIWCRGLIDDLDDIDVFAVLGEAAVGAVRLVGV